MKVVISIVNFNTKELTKQCLQSVFNSQGKNNLEVWVLDNASSDGSVEMIKKDFPRVKLIENSSNVGFGAGHNLILKKAQASYYLVLNSDCELEKNTIDNMVSFMEEKPEVGISSCKILGFDEKLQPSAGDLPFGRALFNWLFNLEIFGVKSSFHRNEPTYYQDIHEVGWVSGNFMIIRDSLIKKIGYFNENFFLYFEDAEYCYRAKKGGYKIMLNPKVSIKHLSGGSLDDPNLRQWSGEYRGLIMFYNQIYGIFAAGFIKLLIYLSAILRIVGFGLKGNLKFSNTYAKVIFNI